MQTPTALFPGVYHIHNTVTGRSYIGCALDIGRRVREHRSRLRHGRHQNAAMQADFDAHGEDSFEVTVIEEVRLLPEKAERAIRLREEAEIVKRWRAGEALYNMKLPASRAAA